MQKLSQKSVMRCMGFLGLLLNFPGQPIVRCPKIRYFLHRSLLLKGQSHEKVGEIRAGNVNLVPNLELVFKFF
jgi:hypothetical protein